MKRIAIVVLCVCALGTALFAGENPRVIMNTSMGEIEIELYSDRAPVTVANFLKYVDNSFYDNTIFHRVIGNFMIQGGGFVHGMGQKRTLPPIKNEADNGLSNSRGTIAMARTSAVNSATAQFFINVKDNRFLDFRSPDPRGYGYCVFGRVVSGMDVVDRIRYVRTGISGPFRDVPVEDVVIRRVRRKHIH